MVADEEVVGEGMAQIVVEGELLQTRAKRPLRRERSDQKLCPQSQKCL